MDSTNNYAMGMVQNGVANSGDAVFAIEQVAGKGRRGKKWESRKEENILLTVIAGMQWLPVLCQFQLSVAAALACHDFFSLYIEKGVKIKWPNDIYIDDRKAGGILIENVIQGNLWQWALIGLGLNINQGDFEDNLNATSLKQITGKSFNVQVLAKALQEILLARITDLQNGEYSKMLAAYNKNLFARDEKVTLKKGNVIFKTTIQRISSSGELITKDVMERSFGFDEVEWIGLTPTPLRRKGN